MIPRLETSRLILKGIELADAPSYQKHFCDYAVISQLASVVPWPYPENGAEDFVRTFIIPQQGNDRWFWGIFLKENPEEMIGGIDLWCKGTPENRGFWLGKSFWGRGYMTEAVEPVMDYAFDHLGFEKLIFSNALGNSKSRRIKEKTGARLIGTRAAKFVSSEYTEAETWELTKEEWKKFKSLNSKNDSTARPLNERNIFLLDGIGALVSATVTGLILPVLSQRIGLPHSFLYFLAAFPVVYGIYSLSCYWFVNAIRPWMLITIVMANLAYCMISGVVIFVFPSLTVWGRLFLTTEILVILLIVALELKVYRKAFVPSQHRV